jgi:hypothetical protein
VKPSWQHVLFSCLCLLLSDAACTCGLQAAPASTHYITRLVKQLVTAAEETQQEFSEPLLELNTALLLGGATQQVRKLPASIGKCASCMCGVCRMPGNIQQQGSLQTLLGAQHY